MSEENTAESNGSRSFQERVFARFDAVDNRLNVMDTRIEKLEMKEYDTKPIWEQALAAILETRAEVESGLTEVRSGLAEVKSDLVEVNVGLGNLRADMEAGFASVRNEMEHQGRRLARKLDTLADSGLN
jgi:septal ring factor EnvC (AmiA/AmiB activator)